MGLDIYVGPLSRYYAGDWETVIQRWGRESGTPVTTIRPPGHEFPPVDEVHRAVLSWRQALATAFGDALREPLDWSEDPAGDYVTDKPGADGRSSVILLAAQQEFPSMSLPSIARDDIGGSSLWDLVSDRHGSGQLRSRIRNRLGMTVKPRKAAPYEHIYFATIWFPVEFELVPASTDIFGRLIRIGSVPALRRQLQHLHDQVALANPSLLAASKVEGAVDRKEFAAVADNGLKIWLALAAEADERRMPMILDW